MNYQVIILVNKKKALLTHANLTLKKLRKDNLYADLLNYKLSESIKRECL
jgi:hypothetical protein